MTSLLVELRLARGLTQEELAARAGMSARSIGDLERGATRRPRRASLDSLADALGLAGDRRAAFIAQYRFHADSAPSAGGTPVPAELPAGTSGFVGRRVELERLDALVRSGARVVAIEGGAGMGKTELALHWAHRARADFPDGQLFASLNGFGTTPPTRPEQVLDRLLRALGVAAKDVPTALEARSALLRTTLADRRVLLILDNAADSAQVRPLLPGTAAGATVITSRRRLEGLQIRSGARRLELGRLSDTDAAEFLDGLIDAGRAEDRARVLALCHGMPLALRLVASRLADSTIDRPVLDLAAADDPTTGIRELLSWSVRQLGADAHRLFAGLGLLPFPGVQVSTAAATCGWDLDRVRAAIDQLAGVNLVQTRRSDRFVSHDLVHEYARERAATWSSAERDRAYERVEQHYVTVAATASRRLGMMVDLTPDDAATVPDVTDLGDVGMPQWLRDERPALVAIARRAGDRGAHDAVRRLSDAWWRHLYKDMRDDEALELHQIAATSADRVGDRSARRRALQNLAIVNSRAGRTADARRQLEESISIAADTGNPAHEAEATAMLASMHATIGEYREALGWAQRTLELTRRTQNWDGESSLLSNIGMLQRKLGDLDAAAVTLTRALAKSPAASDIDTRCAVLNNSARSTTSSETWSRHAPTSTRRWTPPAGRTTWRARASCSSNSPTSAAPSVDRSRSCRHPVVDCR